MNVIQHVMWQLQQPKVLLIAGLQVVNFVQLGRDEVLGKLMLSREYLAMAMLQLAAGALYRYPLLRTIYAPIL